MLKSDVIALLIQKRGVTGKQAESTLETIFGCMKDALCNGEKIEIRGMGAIHVKHYEGYAGHNPKTGQVVQVKPKRRVHWRTGKDLSERLNRPAQQPDATAEPATPAPAPAGAGDPDKALGTANNK